MSAVLEKFPLPLLTRTLLGEERSIVLEKPFEFESARLGRINIPTGFFSDLASVPRLFWRLFPPSGKYTAAAIVHDFLYYHQSAQVNETDSVLIARADADAVFLEAMEALETGWFTRHAIYRSVRIGGFIAWKTNYKKRTGKPYHSNMNKPLKNAKIR
ncbi:MAG: DUF1353 domain-containing protein [Opitutaceae bacterium]|jgi:hypothetical protein|nr:DUF1353 domain-containing protein [Opitutaceae bacterium]